MLSWENGNQKINLIMYVQSVMNLITVEFVCLIVVLVEQIILITHVNNVVINGL
jgi:hypothetical protein